jgi:hypothetical protein
MCCTVLSKKHNGQSDLVGVRVLETFPAFNKDGTLKQYDSLYVNVFSRGTDILLELPYKFDTTFNGTLVFSEKRVRYLFMQKNSERGVLFSSSNNATFKEVDAAAIFKQEWIGYINLNELFLLNKLALTSKERDDSSFTEVYAATSINDTSIHGTCKFTFSRYFPPVNFSLSSELDSIYNMKLVYASITTDPRNFKTGKYLSGYTSTYQLEQLSIIDSNKYSGYFAIAKKLLKLE